MLGNRWSRGLAAAIVVVLASAATAQAAGDSIHIQLPSSVKLGTGYKIKTYGSAVSPANHVAGWESTAACKFTLKAEYKFLGYAGPALLASVSGNFSKTVKYTKATTGGTIYWCAYLYSYQTGKTYATAFGHFKEHH